MTEINPICRQYSVQKPKDLTAKEQADLVTINDLAIVLGMYSVIENASAKVKLDLNALSDRAYSIYSSVKTSSESTTTRILERFEAATKKIDLLPKKEQEALAKDRAILVKALETMKMAVQEMKGLVDKLSPEAYQVYAKIALSDEVKNESAAAQIMNGLQKTAEKLKEGLRDKPASGEKAVAMIKAICTPIEAPKPVAQAPQPAVEKPKAEGKKALPLDMLIYIGPGFGYRAAGAPESLSEKNDRGGLLYGGIAGEWRPSDKLRLNGYYRSNGAYDFIGDENLVYNNDDAELSVAYKGKDVSIQGQAGWEHYRSDYPSELDPNTNVGTAELDVVIPMSKFTLNITADSWFGTEVEEFGDKESPEVRIKPRISVSYHLPTESEGPVSFSLGPQTDNDIDDSEHAYGGFLGVAHKTGKHDISSMAGYLKHPDYQNLNLAIRYDYNDTLGGIVSYDMKSDDHRVDAFLFGKFKLPLGFFVQPTIGFEGGTDSGDFVANVKGFVFVGWGEAPMREPNDLTPFSFDPLPEVR